MIIHPWGNSKPNPFLLTAVLVIGALSIFWFVSGVKAETQAIFSDGFEDDSGLDDGFIHWTQADANWDIVNNSAGAHDGDMRADVKGDTLGDDVLLKSVSTVGYENISLSFWYKVEGFEGSDQNDHVYVEYTADGSNWSQLDDFADGDETDGWTQAVYNLPDDVDNNPNFGFRFRASLNSSSDAFKLDDVTLTGDVLLEDSPTPTPSEEPTPTPTPTSTPKFVVYKYDYNSEELIPGWNVCLYEAEYNEEIGNYVSGEEIECQATRDEYDEENDETGQHHGAAVFSGANLEPDRWYIVDEEDRDGWRLDGVEPANDYVEADSGSDEQQLSGQVAVRLDEDFFNDGQGAELYLYNRDITSTVTVVKYYQDDFSQNVPVAGWEMCIYEAEYEPEGEHFVSGNLIECKKTDRSGVVTWQNLLPGRFYLIDEFAGEENREEYGWWFDSISGDYYGNYESGRAGIWVDEEGGRQYSLYFYNRINDTLPPQSSFENSRDHEVIDTELVSLELRGTSQDAPPVDASPIIDDVVGDGDLGDLFGRDEQTSGSSGIKQTTVSVYQLGGSDSVQNYPADSFFDIFVELKCPIEPQDPPLVPIEIISLDLVSVNPIAVNWSRNWTPLSSGIYCFEAKSADYAGNEEHTAWAGPVAYVPVAQISGETSGGVTETSFTVEWKTDKPATSRVIYDTVPHSILGEAPNYGYAFSTPEQDLDPKVASHSVTVSDLAPGTTYYYRTVSAASPESVGDEDSTSTQSSPTPTPVSTPNVNNSGGGGGNGGSSGGGIGSFINTSTPTPTVYVNPTPILVSTSVNTTGNSVAGLSVESESEFGVVTVNESGQFVESPIPSPSENSPESVPEESTSESNLFASIGNLLGSVSLWWLLVMAVAVIFGVYFRGKKSKKI